MLGAWAAQPTGFNTVGPVAGPLAATGVALFDGVGRVTGVATANFNGIVNFPFSLDGSYTVTADCKVQVLEESLRITFEGYLANGRTEALLMEPDQTTISLVTLRRQNIDDCSPGALSALLNDTWAMSASGYDIITGGRFASNSRISFSRTGAMQGTALVSTNGRVATVPYTGTWSGRDQCSLEMVLTDDRGNSSGYYGSLFDGGKQFLFVSNDFGVVIAGIAKKP